MILIERIDFADASAVGFNKPQAMEDFCRLAVSGLGNAAADIISRQTGQQSADGNELDTGIVDVDDYAAAVAVVAINKGIEQRLALEGGSGMVAKR